MAAINTGNIAKLLWPGLNAIWGREYEEHPMEWPDLVDQFTSEKAYEEDQLLPGFGLAAIKPEGQATQYDTSSQGITTRYTHVAYSLGFVVTHEAMMDNQYKSKAFRAATDLGFSFRQTKENVIANLYNRAFSSSYTYGDGSAMCVTNHSTLVGSQSNTLTTAADMSEASLEDLAVIIMAAVDERGRKISLTPRSLIVPPQLVFEAARILKSTGQNDTANNAINAMKTMGVFPEGAKANHYLTDTDAFFIRTSAKNGVKYFAREAPTFGQDNDFDTDNLKYKAYERYSAGLTDFRGVYASPGA